MILQIDFKNNKICHKWYSLTKIVQNTSYDENSIKKAIKEKRPYGEYLWLEYNEKQLESYIGNT